MFGRLFKKKKISNFLTIGRSEEAQNNLEGAYGAYEQAAALGSGEAMLAIAALYQEKRYRMVETDNVAELLQKGIPLLPWMVVKKTEPNYAAALEWYCKAAEHGEARGYALAGVMLCEGIAGSPDLDKGLSYLQKAAAMGIQEAQPAIAIYAKARNADISDAEYDNLLREFISAVEEGNPQRYALYYVLKGGTDRQKTKLGYALVTRRNLNDPRYGEFKYLVRPDGVPLIPCSARRTCWKTFIRIDLNAFSDDDVLIGYSSDFLYSNLFDSDSPFFYDPIRSLGRLKRVGVAAYTSPAFGWLREKKRAIVFKIARENFPEQSEMERIAGENGLQPMEYTPEHVAFLLEDGEKEYSSEIVAIANGKVQVLFRYTVDGSDVIHQTFEPELLELKLDNP